MPPTTRSRKSAQTADSEAPNPKRQRTGFGEAPDNDSAMLDIDDSMDVDLDVTVYTARKPVIASKSAYDPRKNAHLKGRRRFTADLDDIKAECKDGLMFHGLRVKKVRPGDDEGSVEVFIENQASKHVLSVNLLVSDTSEYPSSHSCFGYSPDPDISARLQDVVENIASQSSRPLRETLEKLLSSVAKAMSMSKQKARAHESETEEEEEEEEDYTYHDFDDFDTTDATVHMDVVMTRLKQEFIEIVGTSYRPGLIRLGGDDFVLSVSLPVIELANSVPPRALMAWDRRLLSRSEHLTLLISGFRSVYPALESDGTYTLAASRLSSSLSFKVGLCRRYKPGKEYVEEVARKHGLIIQDAEDELRLAAEKAAAQAQLLSEWPEDEEFDPAQMEVVPEDEDEEEKEDEGRFERFSLSSSLESLMDHSFLKVLQLRRKFNLGWAGAEVLHSEVEKCQMKEDDVFNMQQKNILDADKEESKLGRTTMLPHDPLSGLAKDTPINLPLAAFCYLIRRLSLVTRYCLVCHNKLQTDFEALKPYVCDSKLCSYQYYSLNHGPSLEYEIIHNPQTVDLLVSLAYDSATEHAMKEPLPIGMGLRVPHPGPAPNVQPQYRHHMAWNGQPVPVQEEPAHVPKGPAVPGDDDLVEFDDLDIGQMRLAISKLIDSLPPIDEMKKHLQRKVKAGKSKPKLKEMDPKVLPAAWAILRWCVASCTAHIEEITSPDELVKGVDPIWRQFRLSVGAPDAEAKFKNSVVEAQKIDNNAKKYPVLYAFHGSPVKNWHSIVRHGLWFKDVANGRAYGNGVYLAKDSSISMGSYSTPAGATWRKSSISPSHLAALVEVVNLPSQFVSSNPYFVVQNTHWLMCRYLLVKGAVPLDPVEEKPRVVTKSSKKKKKDETTVPLVQLDPAHPTQASHKPIGVPDPAHHVEVLLDARRQEYTHVEPDREDLAIFEFEPTKKPLKQFQSQPVIEDDDEDYRVPAPSASKPKAKAPVKPKDDWKHNEQWVTSAVENLMPPPVDATPSATMAVQRELKAMLKEQDNANSFKELGWYMPPDLIGDNLFQWIVEMHSFDPDIPIAKDMKVHKLNSIIFEVRFPPDFPIAPPFFRILTPRFLPFIQGGGGHITGGGSICMDLLTSSGWLPSYSVPAVIMQIKLAISNLEPRPARLARDWQRSYGIGEALEGYKRAAATHGWRLPKGIDHLVR